MSESNLNDLLCCPHCGGGNGFHYKSTQRFVAMGSWRGGDTDCEFQDLVSETKPKCLDCGKFVEAT